MKKIVLEAGHGLNTPGKQTPDGVKEWKLNNAVAKKVEAILEGYKDVRLYRVDDITGVTDISLYNRVTRVKEIKPQIYISIHHNALGSKWHIGEFGVETYAHPHAPSIDKELAQKIVNKLSLKTGLKNRGQKNADFYILRETPIGIPVVLTEGGFMDATVDNKIIVSEKGQQAYAEAIAEVIIEYLNLQKKDVVHESNQNKEIYRVVCGSYANRNTANRLVEELTNQGYDGVWIDVVTR